MSRQVRASFLVSRGFDGRRRAHRERAEPAKSRACPSRGKGGGPADRLGPGVRGFQSFPLQEHLDHGAWRSIASSHMSIEARVPGVSEASIASNTRAPDSMSSAVAKC
jgi:hypothetical protein